jgi:hypothetical protein
MNENARGLNQIKSINKQNWLNTTPRTNETKERRKGIEAKPNN